MQAITARYRSEGDRDEDYSTSSFFKLHTHLAAFRCLCFKPFKTILRHFIDVFMIDEDVLSLTNIQGISLSSNAWKNGVLAKPDNVISGFASTGLWPISAPKMLARRELYADGGVKNGNVPSNPVWLTVRQDIRRKILFLPKPSTKCKGKRKTVNTLDHIMTQEQLQQIE